MTNIHQKPAASKAPNHIAYTIHDSEQSSFWARIGCGWTHSDAKGQPGPDAFPRDGKITVRLASDAKA